MSYLIAEIIVCLLLAAVIGFLIGWLLSRAAGRTRLQAAEGNWATRLAGLERERDESLRKSEATAKQLAAEQQTGQDMKGRLDAAISTGETHTRRISELSAELEKWRLKTTALEKSVEERSAASNALRLENDDLKARLAALAADLEKRQLTVAALEKRAGEQSGVITGLQSEGNDLKARLAALTADLKKEQAGFRRLTEDSEKRVKQLDAQWTERLKETERSRDEHRRQAEEAAARHLSEQRSHEAARKRAEELTATVASHDKRIAALNAEIENYRRKTNTLQKSADERTALFAAQEQETGAFKDRIAALHADLAKREERIRGLETEQDSWRARCRELEAELSRREERLAAAATTLSTCELDLTTISKRSAERNQELSGVLTRLRERVGELEPAVQAREAEIARLLNQIADWEKRYAGLDERLDSCQTDLSSKHKMPANLLTTRPDQVDDLKEVRGIGPVLERVLNRLGIYLFRQIASFTPEDVAWVAGNLPEFPGRIIQERWIDQSRELHARKYGSQP